MPIPSRNDSRPKDTTPKDTTPKDTMPKDVAPGPAAVGPTATVPHDGEAKVEHRISDDAAGDEGVDEPTKGG